MVIVETGMSCFNCLRLMSRSGLVLIEISEEFGIGGTNVNGVPQNRSGHINCSGTFGAKNAPVRLALLYRDPVAGGVGVPIEQSQRSSRDQEKLCQ